MIKKILIYLTVLLGLIFLGFYIFFRIMISSIPDDKKPASELLLEGSFLSGSEAEKLEKQLQLNPDNTIILGKLLGYYWQKTDETSKNMYKEHVFWLISHHPDAEIAGLPDASLDTFHDKQVYEEAKKLWLDQIRKNPKSVKVIENAANFFELPDGKIGIALLEKAVRLEPSNPKWFDKLGHFYELEPNYKMAFKNYEKAFELTTDSTDKFYLLRTLSKVAFESGDLHKAKIYSEDLLNEAPEYKDTSIYFEALHDGNMVLGRIALKSGDLEGAKKFLIKAGNAPGSSTYSAFGPNMSLAKDLLERGETKTVIQYFQLCSNFWYDKETLANWTTTVKEGKIPDFGANLDY